MPYLRPMATITADTLAGFTPDRDGAGVHDVIGTRCDPYMHRLMTGLFKLRYLTYPYAIIYIR